MEVDEVASDKKEPWKRHSAPKENSTNNENSKKVRLFSAKEFRKKLREENRVIALKHFLSVISESNGHDYVFEYLESGGNCLELLHILEQDSNLSPVLVFELVAHVLLKITAIGPQYQTEAFGACRYMLNNYTTVMNKMLGLSSSTQERKVCLKLLTAMVTFSSSLAKDVLLHINFHTANMELLTKNTGERNSVRDHFIHFLTAFLIDGYYPSLSVLLDKKGFIASIIKGLQFDLADTVCIVISAMKNHILENQLVSKTAKMRVFNTLVVRDIVNLYNWKGPAALKVQGKNKSISITIDEYSKSRVNECVHDFLIVLCTSHKLGVIFRDFSLGLGKKNQNALMYTVLESLERPWEHSYASELVTKICVACPDLTKTMWTNVKSSLEPRLTQKWLIAMNFAKTLLKELQPTCIEFCAKELTVTQLAQVIQILVAPLPILKIIIPESRTFSSAAVKRHIISLLLDMLSALNAYITTAERWLTTENHRKLKTFITNHITKNFLDANTILTDWETENIECGTQESSISNEKFLDIVFDIFNLYSKLAPQLLHSLTSTSFQITDYLKKLSESCTEERISARLQAKMINIFVDLDPANFSPNTELFSFSLPFLFKYYYATTDRNALIVLNKLLRNTGIFDGCLHEINIWINGILNLRHFDESVVQSLVEILQMTAGNIMEFSDELSLLKPEGTHYDIAQIIEKLKNADLTEYESIVIKHKYLSPMILGLIKYLQEATLTKSFKSYVNFVVLNLFHCQTQMKILAEFVRKYDAIPENIKEYILSWTEKGGIAFFKHKGRIKVFANFSVEFLSGNIENVLKNIDLNMYDDLPLNLLQASIFYISNLMNYDSLDNIFDNCSNFINHLIQTKIFHSDYIETVLTHPVLLDNFSLLQLENNAVTKFLLNIIKLLLDSGFEISHYLNIYREKLLKAILKILKKPKKYNSPNFTKVLQLFQLNYDQCCKVLTILAQLSPKNDGYSIIILEILSYALTQISELYKTEVNVDPLDSQIIENLTTYFNDLSKNQDINVSHLSESFQKYLEVFPHHIKHVNSNLFSTLLNTNDYVKENVTFLVFLLERNTNFFDNIKNNIDDVCAKKGVLLPILQVLVDKNVDESILKQIYKRFEASLTKVLLKPQKAGQHYNTAYRGVAVLVEKFMPLEKCTNLTDKVQKFEVTEVFHVKLLEIVFNKVIDNEATVKQLNNIILTFVHLQMQIIKRNLKNGEATNDLSKLKDVVESFNSILRKIKTKFNDIDLQSTKQTEVLNSYFLYCLKFGISGETILLKSLTNIVKIFVKSMKKNDAKLIMDMLLSHSKFLDVMLNEHSPVKLEILSLFLTLCQSWNELMERFHVPMLLASYRAKINSCDRIIWTLFKMYDKNSNQTNFHDFKPFLWGKAAANHYSVRQNIENALWRQPKMKDILDILQEDLVLSTIANYPLKEHLELDSDKLAEIENCESYDLKFLIPLFSQILAPEQQVQTYTFTRSGALSLTVVALSSDDQKMREAACHVLGRFHFHVDANQRGKDNPLWIRYVEAVCKGIATLPEKKLNNFSAIYLARMALILTQPNHVMYVPLSQHLTAKSSLDFSTIPELYTFLHSSDVNYKEHRHFMLELLKDGLRTGKDFTDFLRSMAFKLFSELYNSSLADLDTKLLILDVILAACKIPLGAKMLCENHSLLTQLFFTVDSVLTSSNKEKQEGVSCVSKTVLILLEIGRTLQHVHSHFMIFNTVVKVVKDEIFNVLSDDDKKVIFEILYLVCQQCTELFTNEIVNMLLEKTSDKFCKYVFKYGCDFINISCLSSNDVCYLRLLFLYKMKT